MTNKEKRFVESFREVSETVTAISESRGWFIQNEAKEIAVKIVLMHSELSEALESLRVGDPPSDHIPEFTGMEEEFADVIIRIMHVAYRMDLRVAEAMLAKLNFNISRPYKHGGKAF